MVAGLRKAYDASSKKESWDRPIERTRDISNTFYNNSFNKESRASKYWDSAMDEYDLPPMSSTAAARMSATTEPSFAPNARNGFVSAAKVPKSEPDKSRLQPPPPRHDRRPSGFKPPTLSRPLAKLEYSEPQSFDFSSTIVERKPEDMARLAQSHQAGLDKMKRLGLPPPIQSLAAPEPARGSGYAANVSTFQSKQSSALAAMKNLGAEAPAPGNKRLGMGRPAPWPATKRSKH